MTHIYVMNRADGHMKIGFSIDPSRRLSEVTGAHAVLASWAHPHAFRVEQAAHRLLAEFRSDGEWFAVDRYAAFSAVVEAMRDHDAKTPAQQMIDLAGDYEVPPPPLPSYRYRLGYIADNGIVPAGRQMKWLIGCGVSQYNIYVEEAPGVQLNSAMKDCREGDLFFVWSKAVLDKSADDIAARISEKSANLVTADVV